MNSSDPSRLQSECSERQSYGALEEILHGVCSVLTQVLLSFAAKNLLFRLRFMLGASGGAALANPQLQIPTPLLMH